VSHAAHHEGQAGDRAREVAPEGRLTGPTEARAGIHPARGLGLRLRPSLEPFGASDGNIYLLDGGPTAELVVEDATAPQRALLELLSEGVADLDDLAERLERRGHGRDEIPLDAVVAQLQDAGVLERPPLGAIGPEETERYGRQLLYFAGAAPHLHPQHAQARLQAARVVVLGCGGLGSWTLCGLACAGVGTLVLVDDDRIELSNLNRQLLFRVADLGRLKAVVAAEALAAFNPALDLHPVPERVASAADVAALIEGADLLIETADWPPYDLSRWINEACTSAGVPHISAGQAPPILRIGPLYVPGRTACHSCQEAATSEAFPLVDELEAFRRSRPVPAAATLGPTSGVIGSILSMEALHWLTGLAEPATLGASLAVDMRTLELRRDEIARRPECPVCGN
jgi:bacteriocin biosynthesis cyclodehydratase domain-containing protein